MYIGVRFLLAFWYRQRWRVQKHQRRFSAMTQDLLELAHWLRRKREHPTGTERKSLNYECGGKGGDRGGLAERKKNVNKFLTRIGLLMEGVEPCAPGQVYRATRCTCPLFGLRTSFFYPCLAVSSGDPSPR